MASDLEIVQDLFNTFAIHGTVRWPVNVTQIVAGASALRDMGPDISSDPRHIMQCIRQLYDGVGSQYFRQLFDTPADVDDLWVHYWCPQPKGTHLAKATCPAGTVPLWTNGTQTVFTRPHKDTHGNDQFDFGVCGS